MPYSWATWKLSTEVWCNVWREQKWSRYRSGVAQRGGRGIALLFHDRGTRRGWVVSSTPRPNFTPGKDLVHIVQEAGWGPGPVWRGGKSRPHRDLIPDRPARSSVIIPTELPGPAEENKKLKSLTWKLGGKISGWILQNRFCKYKQGSCDLVQGTVLKGRSPEGNPPTRQVSGEKKKKKWEH